MANPSDPTKFRATPPAAGNAPDAGSAATTSVWEEPGDTGAGPQAAVGERLGQRYLLERELGHGGMGVVFLASDQEVKGETFAIKVLNPEIREHPEALALLREEVRKTRALQHPNIVGVYSLNADHGSVYMLMEYLEGKTLDALIDEDFGRGMPLMRAWPLIKDIAAALAYAHDHSVIHSDLKPSNVFVTTSGKAKLLDFGIARAVHTHANRYDPSSLGALTPAYASCEMIEGLAPDQSDDVYAFACVVYEMLSAKHPFDRRSATEARDAGMRPAPLAALTHAQNEALVRALEFSRAKRTVSVEALVAQMEPTNRRALPWQLWLGAGAALLIILGGLGWFLLRNNASLPSSSHSPGAASATDAALARIGTLQQRAQALGVDTAQAQWQAGLREVDAARQSLAAGDPNAAQRLLAAEAALAQSIRSGARSMQVGSTSAEIELALKLCRDAGARCSPEDFADESSRIVSLPPFELDQTEVTNRAFGEYVAATGALTEAEHARGLMDYRGDQAVLRSGESWKTLRDATAVHGGGADDYPVRGIDYNSASKYCEWRHQRLPSGDEWEFVARGPDRHIFASGDQPPAPHPGVSIAPLPVSAQPPSGRFGNRGLGGSLWEWVSDGKPSERVLRGASWRDTSLVNQRLATRRLEDPTHAYVDTGFRCAHGAAQWPESAP